MESQKPKIAMYVKRPFGEKLNASFDFIKENWKQLFKYSTYLILPICLIQAANFSGLMGSMTDITAMQASGGISDNPLAALGPSFALNYAGVIFFSCLGALLMTSLIYAMVRLYNEREERLNGIVFGDIKSLLLRNIKRLFLMGIACSFFIHLCGGLYCLIGCIDTFHTHSDHPAFIRLYGSFGINGSHLLI